MATTKAFGAVFLILAVTSFVLISQSQAQLPSSPCTASMLTSFTPCMNFLTNSSSTGTSPTAGCCTSLRSLMTNGKDCLCQILTAGVPFRIPINRTLVISLPKACNQPGVPIQCKASPGAPVPAPGPTAFNPSASPAAADAPSPAGTIPAAATPALPPVSDTNPGFTPPSTIPSSVPPASTTGTSSIPTPSSAVPSLSVLPSLLFSMAIMVIKYFGVMSHVAV